MMKPTVHGFSVFLRIAVIRWTDKQGDVLLGTEQPIKFLQTLVSFFRTSHVEEILLFGENNYGLGGHRR